MGTVMWTMDMRRNAAIDAFRGLSILAMVFFTFTLALSSNLPDILKHNVRGSFHAGDLVLPMFVFASGMSLAYYLEKRADCDAASRWKDIASRFIKLAAVAVVLSPFSGRGFLQMDEIMLIAICFLACSALYPCSWGVQALILILISISYLALIQNDWATVFEDLYLGGYAAVPYYLPVMLSGTMVAKSVMHGGTACRRNIWVAVIAAVVFIALAPFIPPDSSSRLIR